MKRCSFSSRRCDCPGDACPLVAPPPPPRGSTPFEAALRVVEEARGLLTTLHAPCARLRVWVRPLTSSTVGGIVAAPGLLAGMRDVMAEQLAAMGYLSVGELPVGSGHEAEIASAIETALALAAPAAGAPC